MAAVWELELPKEQKFVLLALADHANDDGYCWPSIARIAWKCGYKERRRASDIIRKLIEVGVLAEIEKAHGRTSTMYQVRPHVAARLPVFDPEVYRSSRGANMTPQGDQAPGESSAARPAGVPDRRGANMTPQTGRDRVGVPSSTSRGAISHTVGVPLGTPESLENHQEPLAPGRPAQRPGTGASGPPDELVLNNSARLLGIEPRKPTETIADFRGRIDQAHAHKIRTQSDRLAAAARQREAEAQGSDHG